MLEQISPAAWWAIVGVTLIIVEVFTGTFAILFFGVAALLVAAIKLTGLNNLPLELLTFGAAGLSGLFFFRKKFIALFSPQKNFTTDTGHHVVISQDIPPGESCFVDYQGAKWNAVNADTQLLEAGKKVVIVRTEGTKLFVKNS